MEIWGMLTIFLILMRLTNGAQIQVQVVIIDWQVAIIFNVFLFISVIH